MKKVLCGILAAVMVLSLCACGGRANNETITVVSREDGSGTRGAFVELIGIMENEKDMTVAGAEVSNSTSVVIQTVADNPSAIGYISLGSLRDNVKALKVDGAEASVEDIKNGSYPIARPFMLCYKEDTVTDLGRDFLTYVMSTEGQQIISDTGYISVDAQGSYKAAGLSGNLSVAGSTSVAPVMEKLVEAYQALNTGVKVTVQQSGSGAGITSTIEGGCEIGMSSRAIKDSETAKGLTPLQIAMDGIAVIVNKENTVNSLTAAQIASIYKGEITSWADVG